MLQDFTATTRPEDGPPRLARLRDAMAGAGLDAWIVPRADLHQGENVAPGDERLAWLTGFTGSAGFAIVTADRAALFVDGRYRLQARDQAADDFAVEPLPKAKLSDWIADALPAGSAVGYDPWLHTGGQITRLKDALPRYDLAPGDNLIDGIWDDQPAPPATPVATYPERLAGRSHDDKRAAMADALRDDGARAAILTLPDSVAWLLNVRGADVARLPVAHGVAILHDDGRVDWFTRAEIGEQVGAHLGPNVTVLATQALEPALRQLSAPVRLDPGSAPAAIGAILAEAGIEVSHGDDPCQIAKATKTPAELSATTEAHLRDGAAMARFLAWLDARIADGDELTEIAVVEALEGFRRDTGALRDIAFDTIAGAGPHGAIVHYRVTRQTNRTIRPGELLLVDSGAQYLDGTTDVTRTIPVGAVPEEVRGPYTRVLKGMIAISRARFPAGLSGRDIDVLARASLWEAGLDYDHGTGHGVGVYLSVHEGPQALSRRSTVPLAPGMIVSNEPGYYRDGVFGIRIENLVAVERAERPDGGDDREWLGFRTLTFVPIDRRPIDADLMTRAERDWIDAYHGDVRRRIGPRLDSDANARAWLDRATAPL